MKYLIPVLALILMGTQASALAAACADTICSGEVSVLYATADGDGYVGLVGGLDGLTGCSPESGSVQYLTLSASSANMKLIYATLLAAQMTGRSVTVAVVANSNGCTIKYVTSP